MAEEPGRFGEPGGLGTLGAPGVLGALGNLDGLDGLGKLEAKPLQTPRKRHRARKPNYTPDVVFSPLR